MCMHIVSVALYIIMLTIDIVFYTSRHEGSSQWRAHREGVLPRTSFPGLRLSPSLPALWLSMEEH